MADARNLHPDIPPSDRPTDPVARVASSAIRLEHYEGRLGVTLLIALPMAVLIATCALRPSCGEVAVPHDAARVIPRPAEPDGGLAPVTR